MNQFLTGPTSWIIWLAIGIVLGWLLELLIDYRFWNRRFGSVEAQAKAEVAASRQNLAGLQSELDKANSARNALQAQMTSLQAQLDELNVRTLRLQGSAGIAAAATGAIGALGRAVGAGNDEAVRGSIVDLETQLAVGATVKPAVAQLRSDVDVLGAELEMAAAEQAALLETIALLRSSTERAAHNAATVAAAGGLVGALGRALETGDKAEVRSQADALTVELNGKANALWEAFTARKRVEALEMQLAQARAAQAVLQKQVDASAAAQRTLPAPPPPPVPPRAAAPAPVDSGGKAALVQMSALALLLSGKEPPALDAERLNELIGEVEATRNVRGQDLLQMIEGIDADREARLYAVGIATYQRLARATPRTAAAAAGVDTETAERWREQAGAIVQGACPGRNRLTVLRRLEPSMQEKLYAAGIATYAAIADADEEQLRSVAGLDAQHDADVAIWLFQAKLLAAAPDYQAPQSEPQRPAEEIYA